MLYEISAPIFLRWSVNSWYVFLNDDLKSQSSCLVSEVKFRLAKICKAELFHLCRVWLQPTCPRGAGPTAPSSWEKITGLIPAVSNRTLSLYLEVGALKKATFWQADFSYPWLLLRDTNALESKVVTRKCSILRKVTDNFVNNCCLLIVDNNLLTSFTQVCPNWNLQ